MEQSLLTTTIREILINLSWVSRGEVGAEVLKQTSTQQYKTATREAKEHWEVHLPILPQLQLHKEYYLTISTIHSETGRLSTWNIVMEQVTKDTENNLWLLMELNYGLEVIMLQKDNWALLMKNSKFFLKPPISLSQVNLLED